MSEVAGLPEPPLGVLLFQSRRHAFGDHPLGVDDLLPGPGERQDGQPLGPEGDRLAPPVEAVRIP